ncbi:MAG: hypothetical protein CMJ64_25500 [Planctomycetaceae bacterium]|nr:hypothetical protein [Planctomycetaceae bacterium]
MDDLKMKLFCCLLALLATIALASPALAESKISFRQLTRTYPVAVQRGSTATVEVSSNFTLNDSHAVFFAPAGPEMQLAETELKPDEWKDPEESDIGTAFHFRVQIPEQQPPGVYEYRIATNQSVSSVAHLVVTDHPVVVEAEGNNDTPANAQAVSIPAAVCGAIERFEDVDYYQIRGEAGQDLVCQIFAQRVTRAIHCMAIRYPKIHLMDSMLTLLDSNGRVIAQNDNFIGGDALLRCKLPTTGEYVLEVRDARYAGDPRYVYCVEVGVPALAGKAARNPAKAGTPTTQTISLPSHVTGQFTEPKQKHYYRFVARKDNYYQFEVQSQRLGFAVDSVLSVFDINGKQLATGDDGHFTKDAKLFFQAPEEGTYAVAVRDLNGRSGDRFQYQLSAEPSGPDFEIHGEYYYGMLAPGGQAIWFVKLKRLNGFDGPVEMDVEGLPKGVSFTPVTIPPGMSHCGLIFTAAQDAPINASLVRVSGRAKLPRAGGQILDVVRHANVTAEIRRAGASRFWRAPIKTQLLGVTKPLDLTKVTASPAELTLRRGSKAEITVRIERSSEYTDQVLLDMAFSFFSTKFGEQLPPGVTISSASDTKLTGDDLEATIVLEATPTALTVDRLPITALARVPITYSIMTNYASNPIYLSIEAE